VLGAVNASARRADRGRRICAASGIDRASAQRSIGIYVMAGGMADFDGEFQAGVSCGYLVGVVLTPPPHHPTWSA